MLKQSGFQSRSVFVWQPNSYFFSFCRSFSLQCYLSLFLTKVCFGFLSFASFIFPIFWLFSFPLFPVGHEASVEIVWRNLHSGKAKYFSLFEHLISQSHRDEHICASAQDSVLHRSSYPTNHSFVESIQRSLFLKFCLFQFFSIKNYINACVFFFIQFIFLYFE